MNRSERIIQILLWGALVCLAGYLMARGYIRLRENPSETERNVLEAAYQKVGKEALSCYLPACFYEEGKENPVLDAVWESIQKEFPLAAYLEETETEEPVEEDESTCHEIIEVNGRTITERILAENQEDAVQAENEAAREETAPEEPVSQAEEPHKEESAPHAEEPHKEESAPQAEQPSQEESVLQTEQPELPAWTVVTETAPVKDLSMEQLSDFDYLLNNFFVVDPNTRIDSSRMDAASLLGDDLKMQGDSSAPQILIYHTHSQEGFADSVEGDENTTVVGVGNYLESLLRDVFGYNVLHLKDAFDTMGGELDRNKAYDYVLPALEQVLAENPSIEVVIDLHRDGVREDRHLVTEINGKPTAQVMYFNGLSHTVNNGDLDSLPNPYIKDNLAFSFQLSYQAAKYYPHFTRCVYLKGYRYNLHVRPKSILLEVGAQTNTVQEAMNAMEPFSVILNKVLKGE